NPPSVTQGAPSGPTITPCGAEPAPSAICSTRPLATSSRPSAPCPCAVYQTGPPGFGSGATSCGRAPFGTSKVRTSAAKLPANSSSAASNDSAFFDISFTSAPARQQPHPRDHQRRSRRDPGGEGLARG